MGIMAAHTKEHTLMTNKPINSSNARMNGLSGVVEWKVINIYTGKELGRVMAKSERAAKIKARKDGIGWDWQGAHAVWLA